ncbi:hypothetical protein IQ07DRAFT_644626 [Pyrenochaeta sp. DS3sAY3a]|nr:hypothetical protein IQ07DRAFT_644626 [Pyrenochaeta sp. DS3sAY3a]
MGANSSPNLLACSQPPHPQLNLTTSTSALAVQSTPSIQGAITPALPKKPEASVADAAQTQKLAAPMANTVISASLPNIFDVLHGPAVTVIIGSGPDEKSYVLPEALLRKYSLALKFKMMEMRASLSGSTNVNTSPSALMKRKLNADDDAGINDGTATADSNSLPALEQIPAHYPKIPLSDVEDYIFGLFLRFIYQGAYALEFDDPQHWSDPMAQNSTSHNLAIPGSPPPQGLARVSGHGHGMPTHGRIQTTSNSNTGNASGADENNRRFPSTPINHAPINAGDVNFRAYRISGHYRALFSHSIPPDFHHRRPLDLEPKDVPPSIRAWILGHRLRAAEFMNHAMEHVFHTMGVDYVLTPALVQYVWLNASIDYCGMITPGMLEFVLDVMITNWGLQNKVLATSPAMDIEWESLLDFHKELRFHFILGLKDGRVVKPLINYNVIYKDRNGHLGRKDGDTGQKGGDMGQNCGSGQNGEDIGHNGSGTGQTSIQTTSKRIKLEEDN